MLAVHTYLPSLLLLGLALAAHAAPIPGPIIVQPGKVSPILETGSMIGGKARDEFSLLGIRVEVGSDSRGERLIFAYGDRFGKPHKGEPGYFHVAIDHGAKRIVIDLAQIQMTAIGPQQLVQVLKASKLISSSEMTMDPIDGSTNITLQTKVPVKLKVGSLVNESAKVSIEMTPLTGAH